MGWPADIFEMRREVQDLVLDVVLNLPCTCPDLVARAITAGESAPFCCLPCRATHVLMLGRRLMGNSWVPHVGVVHRAGRHYASMEYRKRFPRGFSTGGRQTCADCGQVISVQAWAGFPQGSLVMVTLPVEHIPTARAWLPRARPARSVNEPGAVSCTTLAKSRIRLIHDLMQPCDREIRSPVEGLDEESGRGLRPRRAAGSG